jgi:simple sugar transport system substrate-binding protein/ribose transport system substrate-binding protein
MKRLITVLLVLIFTIGMVFAEGQGEKPAPKPVDRKLTIAGIVFQADQFMNVILIGMKAATDKYGAELLTANCDNKPEKEAQIIDTYIARKVDAIAITPVSKGASIAACQRAYDKGIPIILFNSPLDSNFHVSYINSSQDELGSSTGKAARKFIQEKLGGKAKIATLGFKALLPEISDARVNGFLNQIKDLPGVQVVSQQDAWLPEQAVKKVGDILTANPNLDIIYAANEGGTVGATMAVKNAGKAGKIFVFGIDTTPQLAEFLLADDNILQAVTGQDPYKMGYMAAEFAIKTVKGEKVEPVVIVPGSFMGREQPDVIKKYLEDQKK